MKKLFLLSAILIGAASAAHAGVHVGFGFGLPLPIPVPTVVVSHPAPVVYAQSDYCAPAPQVVYQPAYPSVVVAPTCPPARVYVAPQYYYPHRYAYAGRGYYGHGYEHGYYRR